MFGGLRTLKNIHNCGLINTSEGRKPSEVVVDAKRAMYLRSVLIVDGKRSRAWYFSPPNFSFRGIKDLMYVASVCDVV